VCPDIQKWLVQYQSELISAQQLVAGILEFTSEPPTAELIARIPAEIVESIRRAIEPLDATWHPGAIGTPCSFNYHDADAVEEYPKAATWYPGLAMWREYFGLPV
jgi:hypothetical protein